VINRTFKALTLIALGALCAAQANANVVFNWVDVRGPGPDTLNLPGSGRIVISDEVYLAAQNSTQSFGEWSVSFPSTADSRFASVPRTSSDVTYSWKRNDGVAVANLNECVTPVLCLPVFSSTKLISAQLALTTGVVVVDWNAMTVDNMLRQNFTYFSLSGSSLSWDYGQLASVGLGNTLQPQGQFSRGGANGFFATTGIWVLDRSTVPVPAPASLVLILMGLVTLMFKRK
jgi:hypothetical protein